MSKWRNWDKVRDEEKVRRRGALPVSLPGWAHERGGTIPPTTVPERPSGDRIRTVQELLGANVFICRDYYISLSCNVPLFAEMNELQPNDLKAAGAFHEIKPLFLKDIPLLVEHLARAPEDFSLRDQIQKLEATLKRRLTFRLPR